MKEVVAKLHEYWDAKQQAKNLRVELIKLAVECCDADQVMLKEVDVAAYLDGYLAGMGYLPSSRRAAIAKAECWEKYDAERATK